MDTVPFWQVDAFTSRVFHGNPAAVCVMDHWLPDDVLQQIAAENNLSETAFLVAKEGGGYDLRWMTPVAEVDLCGHATLASGWVVLNELEPDADHVEFETRSGSLTVAMNADGYVMDFPVRRGEPCDAPPGLEEAIGLPPQEIFETDFNYLVVL
ncbi:MAG: PhzF family phenazine biosynthesis isomerase, partial [Planctomycetota bacterium]|nr:PhzF family phenazine biosynthesis isomerase [Planctomycetota bacterium]